MGEGGGGVKLKRKYTVRHVLTSNNHLQVPVPGSIPAVEKHCTRAVFFYLFQVAEPLKNFLSFGGT